MSNAIALEATSIIDQYPVYKLRTDMSQNEYTQFKYDWDVFNRVWIYNYTIDTLNKNTSASGTPGLLGTYDFVTDQERISYRKGQISHVAAYPSAAIAGIFDTIPPINLSTFYSLSTFYGITAINNLSTTSGISTLAGNFQAYLGRISTLASLSIRQDGPLDPQEVSTINSIISPYDISTLNSLNDITYISSLIDTIPSSINSSAVSTIGRFVSSQVLNVLEPSSFCAYLVSSLTPVFNLSTYKVLSSFSHFNTIYSLDTNMLSTYSSLSTLLKYNAIYSNFSQSNISVLAAISNTFPYPPSRVSTYASLSTLANYSSLYYIPSTTRSTIASLSTIVSLSSINTSSLNTSNLSTLFFVSTRLSLYGYLSTAILPLGSAASTLATLSTYYSFLN